MPTLLTPPPVSRLPAQSPNPRLVFVYGTLKSGFGNHGLLHYGREPSTPVCLTALTTFRYPLLVRHSLPFVLDMPGFGNHIKGEVWSVSTNTLARLDRLEHHPHWYRRRKISVNVGGEQTLSAWLYFLPVDDVATTRRQLSNVRLLTEYTHADLSGPVRPNR